ncbi:MAG TPA: hypothetical protein VGO62_12820 [Myxococcota bacterium]|jgi:hypothetical protein
MIINPSLALFGALAICGAFVPGPCTFDPERRYDCSLGDPCDKDFACADDGYCKSADVACLDGEQRCEYPDIERVGFCVKTADLRTSKSHCGGCFLGCRGAGTCVDGACTGEPPAGRCVQARGNFDCAANELCVDDGGDGGDDTGACVALAGAHKRGDGALGAACKAGSDCAGGLCAHHVCTSPCDFGCALGFTCDDDAGPGGVCVDSGDEICR